MLWAGRGLSWLSRLRLRAGGGLSWGARGGPGRSRTLAFWSCFRLRVKLKGHLFLEEEVRRLGAVGRVVVGWHCHGEVVPCFWLRASPHLPPSSPGPYPWAPNPWATSWYPPHPLQPPTSPARTHGPGPGRRAPAPMPPSSPKPPPPLINFRPTSQAILML